MATPRREVTDAHVGCVLTGLRASALVGSDVWAVEKDLAGRAARAALARRVRNAVLV